MYKLCGFILLLCCSSLAQANETPMIVVQGNASVSAVPDAFSITFVIEARGEVVSKLNQDVTAKTRQIITFLRDQSVAERHIQTMQIRLNPYYERNANGEAKAAGFVLSRTISVTHTELEQYDALIDGVLRAGANRMENFNFIVSQREKLYEQALVAAMENAQNKAKLLLKPTGAEVGALISVSENFINHQPAMRMRMMAADAEMSSAVPGTEAVSAQLSVTFAVE